LLKLEALGLGDIGFASLTDGKFGFGNSAINSSRTESVFLSAGGISGSVGSRVISIISNFASNGGGGGGGNRGATGGSNSAGLMIGGSNAIGGKGGGLVGNRSVI
jgi:hypothetical protein